MIKDDMVKVTLLFFKDGWILPDYNYDKMVLIPKT